MSQISIDSRVKVNPDVLFEELQGESVLLNIQTGVYFGLDRVGSRMWQLLTEHADLPTVVDGVVKQFTVDEERCTRDLLRLVGELNDKGLVQIES